MSAAAAPWRSHGALAVLGTGSALPGPALDTTALLDRIEAQFGPTRRRAAVALAARMGIRSRHLSRTFAARGEGCAPGLGNPELAARAVAAALADAAMTPADLGFLIGHTATPAQPLPANIALVADRLGYDGPHLELRQACTGFAAALVVAFGLLAAPGARAVAIVGSETGSVFFDPARAADDDGQLVNLVQMGDGAGAVILGRAGTGPARLHAAWFGGLGHGRAPGIQMHRGGSAAPIGHGLPEFEHDHAAIARSGRALFDADVAAAASLGIDLARADHLIPHQVSGRIGEQLAAHLRLPPERCFVQAERVGNTGSAAIWLALDALRRERIQPRERAVVLGAEATKFLYGGFVYDHA